ncbi:MAG: hypothetical protein ACHQM4_09075 [Thermoanaerobaculia bacterium]
MNPGFDRDLSGWTLSTHFSSGPIPGVVEASAGWTPSDAGGNGSSGGAALHALAFTRTAAYVWLAQCVPVSEGALLSFGAKIRTTRQKGVQGQVLASLFSSTDCSGSAPGVSAFAGSLPVDFLTETSSAGLWLPATSSVLASPGSRAALLEIGVWAAGTSFYGTAYADVAFDDVFLSTAPTQTTTWLLPSAAWVHGAGGSYWTTRFTLSNPGTTDAAVNFRWLGHDVDGRDGPETSYVVRAGQTFVPDENTWWVNHPEDYGAILVTSSSPALIVHGETSTPFLGGSVGQALPAFGPADFASMTPKTLAPIRENASFRTNLVLANATDAPLTAHVNLFAADGTLLGTRDVDLPPLGMTQLSRVAAVLGAPTLDVGRLAVSTSTPGGLVAAYASVIDNATNDPRTLLPQDGTSSVPAVPGGPSSPNVLANAGFDHDLSGWTSATETYPNPVSGDVTATWTSADASGHPASGGLALHAGVGYHESARISLSQCVAVPEGYRLASFGAKVRTERQFGEAGVSVDMTTFASSDCSGTPLGSNTATSLGLTGYPVLSSNGVWLRAPMMAVAPPAAHSARLSVGVFAVGIGYYGSGYVEAVADDVYATFAPASLVSMILPSAATILGAKGSLWRTVASLVNMGASDASVTLKWLGHDADGRAGPEFPYLVRAGETLPDVDGGFRDPLGKTFGAVLVTSSSPDVFLQSETSSWVQGVGSVGQALAGFGPSDFATASPRTLAPIRENASFRTNLVLANATDAPLTAHVDLFAADGTLLGTRDVDLPPLGMTQLSRVAAVLGAPTLDVGRLAVSTSTPGGLVAAYASVIDNATNDPRTLLPR